MGSTPTLPNQRCPAIPSMIFLSSPEVFTSVFISIEYPSQILISVKNAVHLGERYPNFTHPIEIKTIDYKSLRYDLCEIVLHFKNICTLSLENLSQTCTHFYIFAIVSKIFLTEKISNKRRGCNQTILFI